MAPMMIGNIANLKSFRFIKRAFIIEYLFDQRFVTSPDCLKQLVGILKNW